MCRSMIFVFIQNYAQVAYNFDNEMKIINIFPKTKRENCFFHDNVFTVCHVIVLYIFEISFIAGKNY